MGIGAAITVGLLVAVMLVMFAIKLPIQLAMWEALAPDLKSSDPARRRTARISVAITLVILVALVLLTIIYER